jgi:WD40 repeat protein
MSEQLDWLCVFDRLTNASFETLRTMLGDGVPIDAFCEILFGLCLVQDPEIEAEPRRAEMLDVIRKLFLMIDINGNGDVSWDEFSHYVVHAVQTSQEVSGKSISQHVVFPKAHDQKLDCPRLKKTVLRFVPHWDKYCFLEVQSRQRSVLSLYKSQGDRIRLYAQATTNQVIEDVAYCDSVNALCVTTVSEKLQFFSLVEDPVLAESGQLQTLALCRDHYLEGRHPVLRYDPETALLFAGGSNGTVSILDPSKDFAVLPPLLQKVRVHGTQPLVDIAVLPERGTKMMLSSGLDGKIQMYDIIRQEFFGELGTQIAAHNMSFSTEFSCLVTCSNKSLDPLVWSPHAVSNPFVCRLVDEKFGTPRSRLVECYCPPQSQYCFSADSAGLIKLWDMRKLRIVRAFYADAHPLHSEADSSEAHLWMRCFAAHGKKLDVVSCCRSETGVSLYYVKADNVPERNPLVTHDDSVVSIDFATAADCLVTASKDCVKFWDLSLGSVSHHLIDFWQGDTSKSITACAADSSGKRFYLGTDVGAVSMHSTLTCGMIGECVQHKCSVHTLLLRNSTLFSAGVDGSIHVSSVAGDEPAFLFAAKIDVPLTVCSFDANLELCLAVVGDTGGALTFYDCGEGGNGAITAVSRPIHDPNARHEASDGTVLPPHISDVSCVKLAGRQPFAIFGDVHGSLGIVASRPHPLSGTRLCKWRCYFPRSSQTIFAVALSLDYDLESETLFVADDQGNITLWSCAGVVGTYCLSEVAWPLSIAERLSLPKPTEQPLTCAPKLLAHFSASGTSAPVKAIRIIHDTIFALVDNIVTLFDTCGNSVGKLMQGRGTALDNVCSAYTFRKEAVEGAVDEGTAGLCAEEKKLSSLRSMSNLRRKPSTAPRRSIASAGFKAMTDEEYNELCLSTPEYIENERSYDPDTAGSTHTPPPSPRDTSKRTCRFSRPLAPTAMDARSEKELPYFLQMKSTAPSSASPTRYMTSEANDAIQSHDNSLLSQISDKLDLDDGFSYIFLRPPLDKLKPAGIVEIFSGASSSEHDWKVDMQLNPSSNATVTRDVLFFQPTVIVALSNMPECAKLRNLAKPLTEATAECEDLLPCAHKPMRFVRFQRREPSVAQVAMKSVEPTLDDFVLPVQARLVPRSAAEQLREKVMRSLNLTSTSDLAQEVTSPQRPITPLKDLCLSESVKMVRAATSASRPKPLSFSLGYGQSSALARSPPPSWQNAQTAMERRSASRQAAVTTQLRVGSGKSDKSLSQNLAHDKRKEYLRLLLHLPRVRKPANADGPLNVARRL